MAWHEFQIQQSVESGQHELAHEVPYVRVGQVQRHDGRIVPHFTPTSRPQMLDLGTCRSAA